VLLAAPDRQLLLLLLQADEHRRCFTKLYSTGVASPVLCQAQLALQSLSVQLLMLRGFRSTIHNPARSVSSSSMLRGPGAQLAFDGDMPYACRLVQRAEHMQQEVCCGMS
jgi:hypothetical protein